MRVERLALASIYIAIALGIIAAQQDEIARMLTRVRPQAKTVLRGKLAQDVRDALDGK